MSKISAPASWFKKDNTSVMETSSGGPANIPGKNPWRKRTPKGVEDTRPVEGVIFIPHTQDSDLQSVQSFQIQHPESSKQTPLL